MNAGYENEILDWIGQSVTLELQRYSGNVEDGAGLIDLKTEADRREKERRAAVLADASTL